jgi:hypothetical protein
MAAAPWRIINYNGQLPTCTQLEMKRWTLKYKTNVSSHGTLWMNTDAKARHPILYILYIKQAQEHMLI